MLWKEQAGRKDRCKRQYLAAVTVFTLFLGSSGLGCVGKSPQRSHPYEAHGVEFELGRHKDALRVKYAMDQGYKMKMTTRAYAVKGKRHIIVALSRVN